MSNKQTENVFTNIKTVTKENIQPDGEWIKQSIELREELIKNKGLYFNLLDKQRDMY